MANEPTYLGNFSAVDPAYSRHMVCHECNVSWTGCWDNFQCPRCGEGDLPSSDLLFPSHDTRRTLEPS
jgi:hypothetical protein